MIRIIHLTDFHLNEQNLKEWNSIVRKAMISKLEKLHEENAINLIAYTGDLIEKGGKDFRSAQKAFEIFKDEVIFPITSVLRLSINQFMIIPGNHDIERNKDNEITEIGLKGFFNKDINNVTKYITASIKQNNYAGGIERIKSYKEFERSLYNESDTNNKLSIFGSSFRHLMNEESVGVCCLNSAWRSYDNEDAGNLIIGEEQLQNSYDFISNCDIKIAMIHHPLDWL
ncbi:MAG: metallophosphoesterase, partial [Bacteroidota bacterium]|nr:metallophosphoesterase [Bacteroidota bacterium]